MRVKEQHSDIVMKVMFIGTEDGFADSFMLSPEKQKQSHQVPSLIQVTCWIWFFCVQPLPTVSAQPSFGRSRWCASDFRAEAAKEVCSPSVTVRFGDALVVQHQLSSRHHKSGQDCPGPYHKSFRHAKFFTADLVCTGNRDSCLKHSDAILAGRLVNKRVQLLCLDDFAHIYIY